MKRLEGKISSKKKGLRGRLSRTSGINASYHPVKGVTVNNKYGLRISKSFKGLTLGFQGGSSVFRGRWSSTRTALNANLSKSGISFSTKHRFGTINWSKPQYSSFSFAGIQLRGKKANQWALIIYLLMLIPISFRLLSEVVKLCFLAGEILTIIAIWLLRVTWLSLILMFHISLFLFYDLPRQVINYFLGRENIELDSSPKN